MDISPCTAFERDKGNAEKNGVRHQVTQAECEQIFFHLPVVIAEDAGHSQTESRFYALGQTDQGRRLFAVFTVRKDWIRVISAREMNRNEQEVYKSREATHPTIWERRRGTGILVRPRHHGRHRLEAGQACPLSPPEAFRKVDLDPSNRIDARQPAPPGQRARRSLSIAHENLPLRTD